MKLKLKCLNAAFHSSSGFFCVTKVSAKSFFIRSLVFIFLLPFTFSCHQTREADFSPGNTLTKIIPPVTIILASLPDSSKPEVTVMEEVSPRAGISIPPPVVHSFIDSITNEPLAAEIQGIGLFENFSTDHGLALDVIDCSIMDQKGCLWFGTRGGGVSRYDGKKFTNYTTSQGLIDNNVLCIAEDKIGRLWFGTYGGGVSCYDGKRFFSYTTADGLIHNYIHCIWDDKKGNLWFGTHEGVSRYDGKSFTNYTTTDGLPDNKVYCIAEDGAGDIWFGTANGGVSRYDGQKFTNYNKQQGLANDFVSCITADKNGNLWFGTQGGGVSNYDGERFINYTNAQGLANNDVNGLLEDSGGNLWFATQGGGVSRYDGKRFANFTVAQGLVNNVVWSITEDKNGSIWFGTYGGGVSRYDGGSVVNYTTKQGLADNVVWCTMQDKNGNLWFGTNRGGVSCYNGKNFTNYTTMQGLSNNEVTWIEEDRKGNIWLGTNGGGVSYYNGKGFKNYTTSKWLPDNDIHSIVEDRKGNIWFCTFSSGVSCYDGKFVTHYTTSQGLPNNTVFCGVEDRKGNLWFGTNGGGVSRFDGKSFTNYGMAQGLANNEVYHMTEDEKGNLWFATIGGGVSRFDGESFINYSVAEGVPDNVINSIIPGPKSSVLLGTNSGLGMMVSFSPNPKESKKAAPIPAENSLSNADLKKYTPQIEVYNSATGYPIKDITFMFKDSDGILWMGTGSDKTGLVRFDYGAIKKSTAPPLVMLQAVKLNNELICWNDLLPDSSWMALKATGNVTSPNISEEVTTIGRVLNGAERDSMRHKFDNIRFDSVAGWYPVPQNLKLPYDHNSISFEFGAVETGRNFLVKYQYMLEGYDKDWSHPGKETSASFGNMYEGSYTFKLKAQSPDGIWSEPLVYTFKVLPPWYRRWWAGGLYALLFATGLWRFVKWRTSVLMREKVRLEQQLEMQNAVMNERSRLSRELHDEVGATLSGIAMYSHLTKEQIKNNKTIEVEKSLNVMQQSAGDMVNKLNDIVWLVNPEQDSLEKLVQRLEEYACDMAMLKEMKVKVNVPGKLHDVALPVESRRNIYLFCKEAINNAVKYSGGTLLELLITSADDHLAFSVVDNGKGFDPVTVRRGNGLENMQKRADDLNARLTLQSKPGEGTLVSVLVKIT